LQVAHCPERVNPGDLFWTSENIPRVVGATSAEDVDPEWLSADSRRAGYMPVMIQLARNVSNSMPG